jgi:hypothetical protein
MMMVYKAGVVETATPKRVWTVMEKKEAMGT